MVHVFHQAWGENMEGLAEDLPVAPLENISVCHPGIEDYILFPELKVISIFGRRDHGLSIWAEERRTVRGAPGEKDRARSNSAAVQDTCLLRGIPKIRFFVLANKHNSKLYVDANRRSLTSVVQIKWNLEWAAYIGVSQEQFHFRSFGLGCGYSLINCCTGRHVCIYCRSLNFYQSATRNCRPQASSVRGSFSGYRALSNLAKLIVHGSELTPSGESVSYRGDHYHNRADDIGLRVSAASFKALPPIHRTFLLFFGLLLMTTGGFCALCIFQANTVTGSQLSG